MEKKPCSQYKIRFIDCDPLGHLTNSRYIDYMLNAREDQVNKFYNIDYQQLAATTGCTWVTLNNKISYLKEAKYGYEVKICSQLIQLSEKRATVEIQMRKLEDEILLSVLWTEVIYFDLMKRKSTAHSAELMKMFEGVLETIPQSNFEERIEFLRKQ